MRARKNEHTFFESSKNNIATLSSTMATKVKLLSLKLPPSFALCSVPRGNRKRNYRNGKRRSESTGASPTPHPHMRADFLPLTGLL